MLPKAVQKADLLNTRIHRYLIKNKELSEIIKLSKYEPIIVVQMHIFISYPVEYVKVRQI